MKTALLTIVWADDREICIAGEIFWLTKIVRANWEKVKEEKQMCEALQELFADELKESMEYGEQRKLVSQVCIKLKKRIGAAEIADILEESEEKIRHICKIAERFAPEYPVDEICRELMSGKSEKPAE